MAVARVAEPEARGYYELYVRETARIPMPVWNVPGNHELFGIERHRSLVSPAHPLYGRSMYRHYPGPDYYSFNAGGVHFVGLNTADHDDLWYYGHVDSTQIRWLARDLAQVTRGMKRRLPGNRSREGRDEGNQVHCRQREQPSGADGDVVAAAP